MSIKGLEQFHIFIVMDAHQYIKSKLFSLCSARKMFSTVQDNQIMENDFIEEYTLEAILPYGCINTFYYGWHVFIDE